ncbi:MAG TPA: hypothetical protein GX699_06230 [Firmicutes bacterium]|nr:hypothetical protein [Bacillota bacterium]
MYYLDLVCEDNGEQYHTFLCKSFDCIREKLPESQQKRFLITEVVKVKSN